VVTTAKGATRPPCGVRVVIVDDHDLFRTSVRYLLEVEGLSIVGEAASGEEAVEVVRRCRPAVVLMDLNMPGIGGVEAIRRIARTAPESRVVVLTISAEEEDVVQAILAGACGYLLKTTRLDQLVAGIRAAAAGESFVSPTITAQLLQQLRRQPQNGPAPESLRELRLSPREVDVLRLVAEGRTNAEIAAELTLSVKTVRNTLSRILAKTGFRNRVEAAVYAVKRGIAV
jgi:DNA-binding NarL/FixJ family response regulator